MTATQIPHTSPYDVPLPPAMQKERQAAEEELQGPAEELVPMFPDARVTVLVDETGCVDVPRLLEVYEEFVPVRAKDAERAIASRGGVAHLLLSEAFDASHLTEQTHSIRATFDDAHTTEAEEESDVCIVRLSRDMSAREVEHALRMALDNAHLDIIEIR